MQEWFSAEQLAALGRASVARLPGTARGIHQRAERELWQSRQVKGKGGPGGLKTEYKPDDATLRLVKEHLERVSQALSASRAGVQENSFAVYETSSYLRLNRIALASILQAVTSVSKDPQRVADALSNVYEEAFNSRQITESGIGDRDMTKFVGKPLRLNRQAIASILAGLLPVLQEAESIAFQLADIYESAYNAAEITEDGVGPGRHAGAA